MKTPNEIIEKLKKLIAHEQSARAVNSIPEAEAFAAKIQELLNQHKLTMSEVEAAAEEKVGVTADLVVPRDWMTLNSEADWKKARNWETGKVIGWIWNLAYHIADCNDCTAVCESHPDGTANNKFVFIGVAADVEVAVVFFRYMANLALKMAIDSSKLYLKYIDHTARDTWNFRQSFCSGFSLAVTNRLQIERSKMVQQAQAAENSMALVLIDRRKSMLQKLLQAADVADKGRDFRSDWELTPAFALGKRAGERVALTAKTLEGETC